MLIVTSVIIGMVTALLPRWLARLARRGGDAVPERATVPVPSEQASRPGRRVGH